MRFLVDENLPLALARWLNDRGHFAEHTSVLGLNASSDGELARHAMRTGSVIVTKDKDFLTVSVNSPRVLHVQSGNLSYPELLSLCERVWPLVEISLGSGEPVVIIRGVD